MDSFKEAKVKMAKKKAEIEALLIKGMEKSLLTIEADAKRNLTKNTDEGRARASIAHDLEVKNEEVRGRVGSNVKYLCYLHMGTGIFAKDGNGKKDGWWWLGDSKKWEGWHYTKGMKANPFLQDAIDNNRDKIGEIFKNTLEGLK